MITAANHDALTHAQHVQAMTIFLGTWEIRGKNFSSSSPKKETLVSGEDNYKFMEGNFFIFSDWEHVADNGTHKGVSIMGFDPERNEFFSRNFDNLGFERRYQLLHESNLWKFTGAKERAVRDFAENGTSYTENWEILVDDQWLPLCVLKGYKILQ